jgi:hypothetical protein
MAAKDDAPGLLSKMVRMVRSPAAPWTGDTEEGDADNGLGKQALKEMTERRRRDDSVRNREFDQLRRARRTGVAMPSGGTDSVQSTGMDSTFSTPQNDREGTLRKIAEIEEQMSRQWWKTRPPGPVEQRVLDRGPPAPLVGRRSTDKVAGGGRTLTIPTGFAHTTPGNVDASGTLGLPDLELPDATARAGRALELSAEEIRTQAIDTLNDALAVYQHEPALEDAAIRFANADFSGAENSLRSLLTEPDTINREVFWAALFDFYRACGRHDRYEAIAIEFAERFGRSPPVWFSLAGANSPALVQVDAPGLRWRSPANLGASEIANLVRRTDPGAQPWLLDWTTLETLRDDAAAPLLAAFTRWSREPLSLRFARVDRLTQALVVRTPDSGIQTDPTWWQLRMELLRLLRRSDEFERVALDYCITYEVSPPSWQRPVCDCAVVRADDTETVESRPLADAATTFIASDFSISIPSTAYSTRYPGPQALTIPVVVLAGDIVGDSDSVLAELDAAIQLSTAAAAVVVHCDRLARIDFVAAGSLLNWAAARHAEGVHIQFRDMHRLIAAFATVIGIQEFARLHIRVD